ncbi:mechanosensitive ion channel family protein [Botrimarina sp.]|uniref:mechanosensitive ion channel family protein n=1 Tax=Botrimarina sp. TaxID=2795802 RepID=UPI0032EE5658
MTRSLVINPLKTSMLARPAPGLLLALCFALVVGDTHGQSLPAATGTAGAQAADEAQPNGPAEATPVPPAMRSPRAAVATFVQRMRLDAKGKAAELLDLSGMSSAAAGSRGPNLSFKLYEVLSQLGELPPPAESPPADPDGVATNLDAFAGIPKEGELTEEEAAWSLKDWETRRGFAESDRSSRITLARGDDGRWRFSATTVAEIDELFNETGARKRLKEADRAGEPTVPLSVLIEEQFPEWTRDTYFLMKTYQWLCLLLVVLPVSRLVEVVTRRGLTRFADEALQRVDPDFDNTRETTRAVWKPVGRLTNAMIWVVGVGLLNLPTPVTNVLMPVLVAVMIIAAVFAAFAVIDVVVAYFERRAGRQSLSFNKLMLPLASSTLKVLVVAVGAVAAMATFSAELPTTLLAGVGIGGIAIALASQETLSNFVGSLSLLFDRPFEVGDFVKIEGIVGEVEALGFRSTTIRTAENSQVTMPNSKLASSVVDNWGRRRYRRYLGKLGLEYGTPPDRIEAFCEGIRELIRRHPHTRKDFYAVYFNDFGPSSLDVLMVVFFEAGDWPTELRERHRLLADILRLAESVGVSFAFPTQTLHLRRDSEPATPVELAEGPPSMAGARAAADIAGELANYQDRPGKVKFTGPTDVKG